MWAESLRNCDVPHGIVRPSSTPPLRCGCDRLAAHRRVSPTQPAKSGGELGLPSRRARGGCRPSAALGRSGRGKERWFDAPLSRGPQSEGEAAIAVSTKAPAGTGEKSAAGALGGGGATGLRPAAGARGARLRDGRVALRARETPLECRERIDKFRRFECPIAPADRDLDRDPRAH